jgi:hypothetical protein
MMLRSNARVGHRRCHRPHAAAPLASWKPIVMVVAVMADPRGCHSELVSSHALGGASVSPVDCR